MLLIYFSAISHIHVQCWEDKLRKVLTDVYLNNQVIYTPNGYVKPQTGAAAAAAVSTLVLLVLLLMNSHVDI